MRRSHTRARAHQLRTKLRLMKLENRTISEYVLHIQSIVDMHASIGDPVSSCEHVEVLFQGLPRDYESVTTLISRKIDPIMIKEIEVLLLTHEAHLV